MVGSALSGLGKGTLLARIVGWIINTPESSNSSRVRSGNAWYQYVKRVYILDTKNSSQAVIKILDTTDFLRGLLSQLC